MKSFYSKVVGDFLKILWPFSEYMNFTKTSSKQLRSKNSLSDLKAGRSPTVFLKLEAPLAQQGDSEL